MKSKWWVDVSLFAGFLIAFFLDFTGVELHQWIGVMGGGLATYHLITHWEWVKAVTHRFFGKTSNQARRYYLIDAAIFSGLFMIIGSGLLISTWFNLSLTNFDTWLTIHILGSIGTLLVVLLKLGMHWRWIAMAARTTFSQQAAHASQPARGVAASREGTSRREFLEVFGVVGIASVFALISATNSLQSGEAASNSSGEINRLTTSSQSSADQNSGSYASESDSCTVRCNRRCSYPGHCHKYVDTNNDNRCDLGECI